MGTIVNSAAILLGGLLGLLVKRGISKRVEETAMKLLGVSVFLVGIEGVLSSMMVVDADGRLSATGSLLLIVSLVAGGVLGEALGIDGALQRGGRLVEQRLGKEGFSKGFVNTSLIVCVGAMAVVGALNDGLTGDSSVLFIKAALDFVISVVLASTLGFGVPFACLPVLAYQGAITLAAGWLAPLVSGELLDGICMVGYAIVLIIGTNFLGWTSIATANLLPALAGPVLYVAVRWLVSG